MTKREDRISDIIQQTINILYEDGSSGLTMRKVATNCGMSLSNLQYYYPDRSALLKVTTEHFFSMCMDGIMSDWKNVKHGNAASVKAFVKKLLQKLIVPTDQNQSCIMFREIWSLSIRDKVLARDLLHYYKDYATWLVGIVSNFSDYPERIVSLLMPYSEGYSINGDSLPLSRDEVVNFMLEIVLDIRK